MLSWRNSFLRASGATEGRRRGWGAGGGREHGPYSTRLRKARARLAFLDAPRSREIRVVHRRARSLQLRPLTSEASTALPPPGKVAPNPACAADPSAYARRRCSPSRAARRRHGLLLRCGGTSIAPSSDRKPHRGGRSSCASQDRFLDGISQTPRQRTSEVAC